MVYDAMTCSYHRYCRTLYSQLQTFGDLANYTPNRLTGKFLPVLGALLIHNHT